MAYWVLGNWATGKNLEKPFHRDYLVTVA